ncbi:MAG TPA: enolase C-terminal domain-like protein [bacterium]|nr:enolase C-terminal domain-like protein [bacterium]
MRITGIRTIVEPYSSGTWLDQIQVANPMFRFPRFRGPRSAWRGPGSDAVRVFVLTDEGVVGTGESRGGVVTKAIIDHHLAALLRDQDPLDIELRWEEMWRALLPYGRKGVAVMALSAVDLALWDLLAKWTGTPLYRLLGGAAREPLPVYATHPEPARLAAEGYVGLKVPMPCAVEDGPAGFDRNVETAAAARRAVGPDVDVMVDCFMAWDVEYTLRFARATREYGLRWIEESLPPDDYEGYARLRREIDWTQVATGEHEYTRWGFARLLAAEAADVLQPDVAWAGGITEVRRIAALASARGIPVIPHAGVLQPWTVHLMAAMPNCPMGETIVFGAGDRRPAASIRSEITVEHGRVRPNETPGAGVVLNVDPAALPES